MKTRSTLLLLTALTFVLTGLFSGCKQKGQAVNVSAAVASLKSPDVDARQQACIQLAAGGESSAAAVPDLIPVLKDPDPVVRHLAAYALGQIGPKAKAAIPALKEALNDSDTQVVSDCVNALRFIGDGAANTAIPNVMTTAPSTQ